MSIQNHFDFLTSRLINKVSNLFHGTTDGERKFTFAELKNLYDVLQRNPLVNEANKALVVETVRSIAEFMIWGDQNEPRIFDFFLENNIMVRCACIGLCLGVATLHATNCCTHSPMHRCTCRTCCSSQRTGPGM